MRPIKHERFLCVLIHTYMFSSLLAPILFLVSVDIAMLFYTIGASSSYVAFGIAVAGTFALWPPLAIIPLGWAIIFPVLLFVAYILAIKKRYQPICILIVLDALVVVLWALYMYISENRYGTGLFLADAIVSILFVSVSLFAFKRQGTVLLSPRKQPK